MLNYQRVPPTSSRIFAEWACLCSSGGIADRGSSGRSSPQGHSTTCGLRSKIGFTRNRCTGVSRNIAMLSILLGDILFLNIKNWGLSRQCPFFWASFPALFLRECPSAIPAWLAMDWQIIRKTWRSDTDCFTGFKLLDQFWAQNPWSQHIPTNGCFTLNSELHKVCFCWLIRPLSMCRWMKKPHAPCVSSLSGRIHKPTRDWYRSCRWWTRPEIANNGAHSGRFGATEFANFVGHSALGIYMYLLIRSVDVTARIPVQDVAVVLPSRELT